MTKMHAVNVEINYNLESGQVVWDKSGHPNDVVVFGEFVFLNYVVTNLEIIKKHLKLLTKRIEIDENTTLGQLISKICKKLKLLGKQRDDIFTLFCIDFRNAIAHQHYLMSEKGIIIYPNDIKKKRILSIIDLQNMESQVQGIEEGFKEYINIKTQKLS